MNTVHVSVGTSLDQALAAIGAALDFPDWYGRNLDALADCLTDLEQPTTVALDGWRQLAWHDPEGWQRLRQVLDGRAGGVQGRQGLLPLPAFAVEPGAD